MVLVHDVCDPPKLSGVGDASRDLRYDRERPITLDVGMNALIDEPGVSFIFVFGVPQGFQKGSQPGLACRILLPSGEVVENRGHRF
jgi:hypothetical protein